MNLINKILNIPLFYNATQTALGMDFFHVAKKYIEKYPHDSILEIGCGPEGIIKYVHAKNYLGIDINDNYINNANKMFANENVHYLKLDVKKMTKIKERFDLVIIINVIHHLTDSELNLILKKLAENVEFKKIILLDSKPDIGPLSFMLEKMDQGHNFRELNEVKKIFDNYFFIEKAEVIRRPYWLYKYPTIVAGKKRG